MGNAVGISLLSCKQANMCVISHLFRLLAAIFNLRLTLTSDSIRTNQVVLLDPENMGIAVGDSLLSSVQVEIKYFEVWDRHLGLPTSSFFPFGRTTLPLFPLDS